MPCPTSAVYVSPQVLSALFDRLHYRDAETARREELLCDALHEHSILVPSTLSVETLDVVDGSSQTSNSLTATNAACQVSE